MGTLVKHAKSLINGRRGAFQLLFCIVYTLIGISYLLVAPSAGRVSALSWLPELVVNCLGFIWLMVAAMALAGTFLPRPKDRLSFTALTLAPAIWGFIYLIAWLFGTSQTGWVTTCLYWSMAGAVMVVSGMQGPTDRDERQMR